MKKAPLFFAFSFLAAAGPAAPQTQQPAPAAEKPAAPAAAAPAVPPVAPAPRLNLKLDNPSQYATELPRAKGGGADGLPALGADARPLPPTENLTDLPGIPKDTQPGRYQ